jgi:ketosteroid isomerase-like protein
VTVPSEGVYESVVAANAALYEAFERGDAEAMALVWVHDEERTQPWCLHPGARPVVGREAVLRSWSLLMANTGYAQFFLTDVAVHVSGDSAVVTCTENVLAASTDEGPLTGGAAAATNGFVRERGAWRMWLHHASPLPPAIGDAR